MSTNTSHEMFNSKFPDLCLNMASVFHTNIHECTQLKNTSLPILLRISLFEISFKFYFSDCLQSFTDLETLQESEFYICPKCKVKRPSTKKFWLHRLPNVSSEQKWKLNNWFVLSCPWLVWSIIKDDHNCDRKLGKIWLLINFHQIFFC